MARKHRKTADTRHDFGPTLGHPGTRSQKKQVSRLYSLPPELRQRVLRESLEESFLKVKASLVERANGLSTVCTAMRDDMQWVRKEWLLSWEKLREEGQLAREAADKSWTQMVDSIRRQAVRVPQSSGARPCKNCRRKWRLRTWNGIKPLCRTCTRRGIRLGKGMGKADLRW